MNKPQAHYIYIPAEEFNTPLRLLIGDKNLEIAPPFRRMTDIDIRELNLVLFVGVKSKETRKSVLVPAGENWASVRVRNADGSLREVQVYVEDSVAHGDVVIEYGQGDHSRSADGPGDLILEILRFE